MRAGLYLRNEKLTLYPSYWRNSHCGSHFILWNSEVYWCDWDDDGYWTQTAEIETRVWDSLTYDWINYEVLADQLGEIPWDVLQACYSLTRRGRVRHPKGEHPRTHAVVYSRFANAICLDAWNSSSNIRYNLAIMTALLHDLLSVSPLGIMTILVWKADAIIGKLCLSSRELRNWRKK